MRRLDRFCSSLAPAVAGLLLLAYGAGAQELAPGVASEVKREGDIFVVTASAEIAVPRALAYAVLTDYERYAEFIPEIESSRVVLRQGNGLVLDQKGSMSFLFFSQRLDVRLAVVEMPPARVVSRAIGGSLRDFAGSYHLDETSGGVRFSYSARLVPEFDLPPLIGTIMVRSVIEKNFAAMQREMLRRHALARPFAGGAAAGGAAGSAETGSALPPAAGAPAN